MPSGKPWATALCCGALGCASTRAAPATPAVAPAVAQPAAPPPVQAAAPAVDPNDPEGSRREAFRGCSIAVPSDATREDVDMGLRVLLPTDGGATVAYGVGLRVWRSAAPDDWADFERGLRESVATQHGEVLFFSSPIAAGGAVDAGWRQHVRLERRERGRVLVRGGRYAIVTCSASPEEYGDHQRACDATIESLALGPADGRAPAAASPGMRWVGEGGIFAQAPEGWLPQRLPDTIASLVERHADASALVELSGGDLDRPPAQALAAMRLHMERAGARFTSWVVRPTAQGTKVDYAADLTTTEDRFIRQRILVRGWRLCVATCAGPEDFVVPHDGFCGRWLPTLRVAR